MVEAKTTIIMRSVCHSLDSRQLCRPGCRHQRGFCALSVRYSDAFQCLSRRWSSEDKTGDFLRQTFVDVLGSDYDLTWFGMGTGSITPGSTPGSFYVYGRFSGLGALFNGVRPGCERSGHDESSHKRLGVGHRRTRYRDYDWVPLTDDTLSAPCS
jgi:hypothetical protein